MNQGYQQSAAVASRLDSQLEGMADKPAGRVLPSEGSKSSNTALSATGVPGYYHTQSSQADTKLLYRMKAAGMSDAQIAAVFGEKEMPAGTIEEVKALPGFKVDLTQKDIDAIEKLRQEKLQIEFDDWVVETINIADPGEARWLQQMYPQFWKRREKFLDDRINVEARAAKIRLRGIKTIEDMKFLFAVSKGYIQLPDATAFSTNPGGSNYVKGFFRRVGHPTSDVSRTSGIAPAAFSPTLLQGPRENGRNTAYGF